MNRQTPEQLLQGVLVNCRLMSRLHEVPTADVFLAILSLVAGLSDRFGRYDRTGMGKYTRLRLPITFVTGAERTPWWLDRLLLPVRNIQEMCIEHAKRTNPLREAHDPKEVRKQIKILRSYGRTFEEEIESLLSMAQTANSYLSARIFHDVGLSGGRSTKNDQRLSDSLLTFAPGTRNYQKLLRESGRERSLWDELNRRRRKPRVELIGHAPAKYLRSVLRNPPWENQARNYAAGRKLGWLVPTVEGVRPDPDASWSIFILEELLRRAAVDRMMGIPNVFSPGSTIRQELEGVVLRHQKERKVLPEPLRCLGEPAKVLVWNAVALVHQVVFFRSPGRIPVDRYLVEVGLAVAEELHRHQMRQIALAYPHLPNEILPPETRWVVDALDQRAMSRRDLMRKGKGITGAAIDKPLSELERSGLIVQNDGKWSISPFEEGSLSEMLSEKPRGQGENDQLAS